MYLISEEAEAALDIILEPYGQLGGFYLDMMHVKYPGPRAYVVLRREYDIAKYVVAQRAKLDGPNTFSFTFFDNSVDFNAKGFIPKVGCLLFFSKTAVETAAKKDQLPSACVDSSPRNVRRKALVDTAR